MKVNVGDDSIELRPETQNDVTALTKIRDRNIKSIHFEDYWEQSGSLVVEFTSKDEDLMNGLTFI